MANRNQGFTLIELIVTLSILTIVVSIAFPVFTEMVARSRQQALLNDVWSTVQNARVTAVLHRETIEICGSKDTVNCTSDWSDGWLVHSPGRQQARNLTQLPSSDQLRWRGLGKNIRFRSNGTTLNNGTFYQCHKQKLAWQLKLSRQGRLRIATPAENNKEQAICDTEQAHGN
ncbi:type 4 fimbrial biogenesis protein FimT [Pseudomonas sp. BAY1663]|uniref:GspH/FimT family pseudopilin n=1 Tax=Pseudomonas sp. BAY1663 TaxID=1439940 RepID=UPI00042DF11C|nr:GspH/FimT family pseudopilin [Pseudomonas sp. BAY1663]EXF46429.1 type 4 fimbrial biogenesis protein FimT [Pseudomonas sp. BAY1663]